MHGIPSFCFLILPGFWLQRVQVAICLKLLELKAANLTNFSHFSGFAAAAEIRKLKVSNFELLVEFESPKIQEPQFIHRNESKYRQKLCDFWSKFCTQKKLNPFSLNVSNDPNTCFWLVTLPVTRRDSNRTFNRTSNKETIRALLKASNTLNFRRSK